jgi:hypothetical protein
MKPVNNLYQEFTNTYPFPVAVALKRYSEQEYSDFYKEWDALSTGILQPVLMYLSHLLLSDLVSTGRQPALLYHRIQSVLSKPLMGQYAGFLRETAKYYHQENLESSVPELISFLQASDVDCTLAGDGKALLGELVDYRNLLAHGRINNPRVMEDIVSRVRLLTDILLKNISFLIKYPLQLEDGTSMMGWSLPKTEKIVQPMVVLTGGNLKIRPLLLKMKDNDLMLLEDFDMRDKKLSYRGSVSYSQMKKKEVEKGEGRVLFDELKELLRKVRSEDAILEQADWESFRDRSSVLSQRTLDLYSEMGKFKPEFYVPRKEWDGGDSVYRKFLGSDKTLLAISGVQGTGKSALTAHLANTSIQEGHAVLFINAQRFSFANVEWSGNPYPKYFSDILHYSCLFDKAAIARIIKTAEDKEKKVIIFIDAVNEVDGLTNKWNRFLAMELVLDWIGKIAEPGLKIVVSFRLDIYEEFEYLQEDDEFMPANLCEISYAGNHPRKRWVWDLEPFNEEQARLLFERLKQKPELGMAPDMTWEEITTGLGDRLSPVIDNPLIFQIFLRAHHGEKVIVEKERDTIMMRYAEKLTGAAEAAKGKRWLKIWRFINNGNITKKEQFIGCVISKMAEEGGTAFLIENLDRTKKRDKILLDTINDYENRVYLELKQGGLLIEEKIETVKDSNQIYFRRLTFINELISYALDKIEIKRSRIESVRIYTIFCVLLCLGIYFLISLGITYYIYLGAPESYSLLKHDWFVYIVKSIFFPITLIFFNFYVITLITSFYQESHGSNSIGVIYSAVLINIIRKSNEALQKLLPLLIICLIIITLFAIKYNILYWFLLPGVLYFATPGGILQIYKLGKNDISPKLLLATFKNHLNYYRSLTYLRIRKGFLLIIPLSILSYILFSSISITPPNTIFSENSGFPFPTPQLLSVYQENFRHDIIYAYALFIASSFFLALFPFYNKFQFSIQIKILEQNPNFFSKKE